MLLGYAAHSFVGVHEGKATYSEPSFHTLEPHIRNLIVQVKAPQIFEGSFL